MIKKKKILVVLLAVIGIVSCEPSQKVTGSWVSPERTPEKKYSTVFIAALTERQAAKTTLESELAKTVEAKGYKAIKSSDVFAPNFSKENTPDKETMINKIRQLGCDVIFTVTLIDKQSETRYVPGTVSYSPYGVYGGTVWGYYSYWYPRTYTPGYVTTDKTYFLEGSLFDAATEKMIWSVQTEAYNPTDIERFSKEYSEILWKRAEKDLLNKK